MAIIAKTGGDYEPIEYPVGTNHAVVQSVICMGTSPNPFYKPGTEKPGPEFQTRVYIKFELPESTFQDKEGNTSPQVIGEPYKISVDERSNLYPIAVAAEGGSLPDDVEEVGYDVTKMLGKNLYVVIKKVKKNDKYIFRVAGAAPLPPSAPQYPPHTPPELFEFEPGEDGELHIPESIPGWVSSEIKDSQEYKEWLTTQQARGVAEVSTPAAPPAMPTVSTAPAAAETAPAATQPAAPPAAPAETAAPAADAPAAPPGMPDLSNVPEHMREQVLAHWMKLPK